MRIKGSSSTHSKKKNHPLPIQDNNYDGNNNINKPLLFGCSGGGGHISAIQGIRDFLDQKHPNNILFSQYTPRFYTQKKASWIQKSIVIGSFLTNNLHILSSMIKKLLKYTRFPILPHLSELNDEINTLNEKEKKKKTREYIDMLLDIYPAGYESAAIWNVLQRQDKTIELKKLIGLQRVNDQNNYVFVREEVLNLLTNALRNQAPYTEIISTQAMGLPALCDTVKEYNDNNQQKPEIIIHQYMTDLPTKGAVHFFNSLSRLTSTQQQQIKLYGVGMTQHTLDHFFPGGHHFIAVHNIPSKDNPMVRVGFKNPHYDNSNKFNCNLTISMHGEPPILIHQSERIASIILGSQASHDTVEYIETLIENGMSKVFVFSGKTTAISQKIDDILHNNPTYKEKIIRLGDQGDHHLAQLMTRSNLIITRGGGLSVMEQMAMPHNSQQVILIHHRNTDTNELTSGISWEDHNGMALIAYLKQAHVHADKTSPNRAKKQISTLH